MGVTDNLPKTRPGRATYADIEALPENMVGEILFGVLHTHPRPTFGHGLAATELGHELVGPFRRGIGGPGGWVFVIEPELHLGEHVIVPDLAGWRVERLPRPPATPFVEIAPDWLAEVLSPSTRRIDLTDKLRIYGTFGVGHCWYLDPAEKTLEVLELADEKLQRVATFQGADPVTARPFEAHTFKLDILWPSDFDAGGQS
jgi:Uma2 family endonuclease